MVQRVPVHQIKILAEFISQGQSIDNERGTQIVKHAVNVSPPMRTFCLRHPLVALAAKTWGKAMSAGPPTGFLTRHRL